MTLFEGNISAESLGVRKGSTFSFRIPVEPAKTLQGMDLKKPVFSPSQIESTTIVVANNNRVIAGLTQTQLNCFGLKEVVLMFKQQDLISFLEENLKSESEKKTILFIDSNILQLRGVSKDVILGQLESSPLIHLCNSNLMVRKKKSFFFFFFFFHSYNKKNNRKEDLRQYYVLN